MANTRDELLADVYDDSGEFLLPGKGSDAGREKMLKQENDGLKKQLWSARGLIEVVTKGDPSAVGNKRLRLGGGGDSSEAASSSTAIARSELEESRVLREKDKLRYEVMLREAEGEKGKLLRQVKFLTQEEEEARAVFGKKAAVLMEEISYLRENLSAERAALEAARAEGGHSGEQERQRYNRKLKREEEARRVAEEKAESLEEAAKTYADEVAQSRRRCREVEAKNADLSLEVAALRRKQGVGLAAGGPTEGSETSAGASSSWDTPAARELRAKVTSLEREARKREAVLQGLESDRRNAIALEDEVATLKSTLKRAEDRLASAVKAETDNAAIKDEKEEWSLVFSRALNEEQKAASLRRIIGREPAEAGAGEEEGKEGGGGARPTPLVALRLLREAQEERSLAVKELTALRLRNEHNHTRLAKVEQELKNEKERGESVHARAEEMELELDKLERRCRSSEKEVEAQKELINSYERDTFRKPAGETWLSDHAALESALAAAKEEAESLRRAAEGQVSALEAGRLRGRAAKAEAALGEAIAGRDQAIKAAERYGDALAMAEKEAASGTGGQKGKVLHFKDNPAARAAEAAKRETKKKLEALTEENKRLVQQLESVGAGGMDASSSDGVSILGGGSSGMRGADTPDAKKFSVRLKEMYKERINFYRQMVYLLTGYRIDLMKDPTRQMLRLRSMYAEQESDCLVFQQKPQSEGGGLELVETPLAVQHMDKINMYLRKCDSIPAFLSSLTAELFEKQTFVGFVG
ncbi:conserved unknown protein [Ectocarpus siliculosus]|uniref:Spindle assembly checkpoint component MAD1 n=1 Tax=Ectocarpus siliculosus TaxID=2880 RepID=D8LIV7_ECTSI|nr:conserved unknown protein [Ectocarpus siliculosus]|eukprot:CBN76841.1 conserved unknown protein [Ectocarpus siliculosus]